MSNVEVIWTALERVTDPEIPTVSVVDMGMIEKVELTGARARIVVLPTFTGCPAIAIIEQDVRAAVQGLEGVRSVDVEMSYVPPWTPDRITEGGRSRLEDFGISPPTGKGPARRDRKSNRSPALITSIGLPKRAVCPFCGSDDTRNESLFGPTPCRAVYYCSACRNPFEQLKDV